MMRAMPNSRPLKTASVYMAVTKVFIMMNAVSHNGLRAALVYMAVTKVFIMVNADSDNGLGAVADSRLGAVAD